MNIEILQNTKGNPKIVCDGYMYNKSRTLKSGRISWRCERKTTKCTGAITTCSAMADQKWSARTITTHDLQLRMHWRPEIKQRKLLEPLEKTPLPSSMPLEQMHQKQHECWWVQTPPWSVWCSAFAQRKHPVLQIAWKSLQLMVHGLRPQAKTLNNYIRTRLSAWNRLQNSMGTGQPRNTRLWWGSRTKQSVTKRREFEHYCVSPEQLVPLCSKKTWLMLTFMQHVAMSHNKTCICNY